ncbi:hypothetical protein DM469_00095 [Lactobacillus helveticus]|uniref:Transposase n=1 Tax=Lactobacillus helveticus TaxID=1587 RepID=A0AAU8XSS2_LACHE|nr:hypothetical protein [Lactobacillus helveticus]AUI73863.1 hypothetical protein Lh8105_02875 [Lactobacillus helveticus]MCO0806724.1 hypothetical protein [Lactobacillus helveticus]NRO03703.1 hypothetical protein [Lactobacillus helveticus]NRO38138.1 hypothetical protein [Lactobacillus helveticus]PXZ15127.1 hypothetical protein DM470_00400 [Lactobacillus helveticus]
MKTLFKNEINDLSELQKLLHIASKQTRELKQTLNEINNFKLKRTNKKPEFNENSDHKKN